MLHKTIGKYRVEDVVGSGGMSIVYYAIDEQLNRPTALKVLHKHWTTDQIALHRFKREAQIAQRLSHPNIIKIYEYDEIDSTVFLAMEYVGGGSLAKRFQNPVATTLEQTAQMLTAIALGLDYAHAQGVIHRDLKLENILVADDDRLILSDFGIARMINSSRITELGMVFGTPLYISPEQIQGAKNVDYRTDLYSFAVIAYLLTTGYHPFSGETAQVTAIQHIVEPPPLPSNLNPRLPQAFDQLLLKGLSKAPQDRYESAGALAIAFADAARHDPLVETVVLMRQPTPIISRPSSSKNGATTGRAETILLDPPKFKRRRIPFARLSLIGALALLALIVGIAFTNGGLPISLFGGSPSAPLIAIGATTATATATSTPTTTATQSFTPTATATQTGTPTASATNTATASRTPTATHSATRTFTPSPTPGASITRTVTPSRTPSLTATSASRTATPPTRTLTAAPTTSPAALIQPSATSFTAPANSTAVPPTAVPPTAVPPTTVPPTSIPPTAVPPTAVPPTAVANRRLLPRPPPCRQRRPLHRCSRRFCRPSRLSARCCRV